PLRRVRGGWKGVLRPYRDHDVDGGGNHVAGTATGSDWAALAGKLAVSLHLASTPISISFGAQPPEGVAAFDEPMSEPALDGRRGRVAAGCVFWMRAAEQT